MAPYGLVGQGQGVMGPDPAPGPAPTPKPTPAEDKALTDKIAAGVTGVLTKITLSLIVVAVVTGGSFAVGNWLAHKYVLPKK
jgi:hypothetical protein